MHIKQVQIKGFKSYATEVTVGPFDTQFNAITGLNGTGKSNILDSICFVLGITTLSAVRASKLEELVYKQGQAGVTKCQVTIWFDNTNKATSPVGYEKHNEISVSRLIVIGGKNKYLINNKNVQHQQVANMFHSVQLNVNNPHFLIMQGKITKVINMKAKETLSMIEEAAGTKMYEMKRAAAQRRLEQRASKMEEIQRILSNEIEPTINKLEKEKEAYMEWSRCSSELTTISKFVIAHDYYEFTKQSEEKAQAVIDAKQGESDLIVANEELKRNVEDWELQLKEKEQEDAATESNAEKRVAKTRKTELQAQNTSREKKIKGTNKALEESMKSGQDATKQLEDAQAAVDKAKADWDKAKADAEQAREQSETFTKEIDELKKKMQQLEAGVSANADSGETLQQQILDTQKLVMELQTEAKKARANQAAAEKEIPNVENQMKKWKKQLSQELDELKIREAEAEAVKQKLQKYDGTPDKIAQEYQRLRELKNELSKLEEAKTKVEQNSSVSYAALQSRLEKYNFIHSRKKWLERYPPNAPRNWDPSKAVQGSLASLIEIKPDYAEYFHALEVAGGGGLFRIVTDTTATAKLMCQKGVTAGRETYLPLDHTTGQGISRQKVDRARQIANALRPGATVLRAVDAIRAPPQLQQAVENVFGPYLLVDSRDVAQKICFDPSVRTAVVTKDGDSYNPSGTMAGGSKDNNSGHFKVYKTQWQPLAKKHHECSAEKKKSEEKLAELKQMDHKEIQPLLLELQGIHEKIENWKKLNGESHAAQCRERLEGLKAERDTAVAILEKFPARQEALQSKLQNLETEQRDLHAGRDERKASYEKQVAELDKKRKPLDKVSKQKDSECVTLEGTYESKVEQLESVQKNAGRKEAELEKMRAEIKEMQEKTEEANKELEALEAKLQEWADFAKEVQAEIKELLKNIKDGKKKRSTNDQKIYELRLRFDRMEMDAKNMKHYVAKMKKQHTWLKKDEHKFNEPNGDYDFENKDIKAIRRKQNELEESIRSLGKNINKKVLQQHEQAEDAFKDLQEKRAQLEEDKLTIDTLCRKLDKKKEQAVRHCHEFVTDIFGKIFSTVLPGADAKLAIPEGMTEQEGLEIRVAFGGVWKKSLIELSGGQRSLLSLSLILALLRYKPAPVYILDEVDAALDMSHTQNIGKMIKEQFPDSQFIIVSLKEGMFTNANVLFRTKFVGGVSQVDREEGGAVQEKRKKEEQRRRAALAAEQEEAEEEEEEEDEELDAQDAGPDKKKQKTSIAESKAKRNSAEGAGGGDHKAKRAKV
ncbi:unnamed protein product [Amoebophrya sp. A120]|nr:unnamed protein product [Amoebophrya sp. A120]|eukprot:GSA120T00011437001.1